MLMNDFDKTSPKNSSLKIELDCDKENMLILKCMQFSKKSNV